MIINFISGIQRRLFRKYLRMRLEQGMIHSGSGKCRLLGYGFGMRFPDAARWAAQVLEVLDDDCYRIRMLPAEPHVIDVGANIGTVTLSVLWHRPKARVIVVEPSPSNLSFLNENLFSKDGAQCSVIQAAIGRERGITRLGGIYSDSYRTQQQDGVAVPTVPLSDIITGPTDLLKIDIEGAELEALQGAGKSLLIVRRVAVEYHDYHGVPSKLASMLGLLDQAGFDRVEIDSLRRFPPEEANVPESCCLVHAWRKQEVLSS